MGNTAKILKFEKRECVKSPANDYKIKALTEKLYKYYLDWYLMNTAGTVDIAEALYRAKVAICLFARNMAQIQMEKVIEEGRVDECYFKMRKQYGRR